MFEYLIFFFFAAVAVIFSLVVVLHKNPVVSALALVVAFFSLAVMYVLLDAPFMAALQVIIYAGAIMVLFLFVIMLLNLQKIEEPRNHPIQHFLAWAGVSWFVISMVYYVIKAALIEHPPEVFQAGAREIGMRLFEAYLLPFEMASILLLAAIVGALVLTERSLTPSREESSK